MTHEERVNGAGDGMAGLGSDGRLHFPIMLAAWEMNGLGTEE